LKFIKHHTNARNSIKLQNLRYVLGQEGYGRYWSMLELLGEKFDGIDCLIPVHFKELSAATEIKFSKNLDKFLEVCAGCKLIEFETSNKIFKIYAPILFELQDKDSKYNRKRVVLSDKSTTLRRRIKNKEEEVDNTPSPFISVRELGEIIEAHKNFDPRKFLDAKKILPPEETQENPKTEPKFTPDHWIQLWNECFGPRLHYCHGLGGGIHLQNFIESLKFLPTEKHWRELFQICMSTPRLMGQNGIDWAITPTWIVNYDNALKVLNGDFEEGKSTKNILAALTPEESA
jgi:hypothetical protein